MVSSRLEIFGINLGTSTYFIRKVYKRSVYTLIKMKFMPRLLVGGKYFDRLRPLKDKSHYSDCWLPNRRDSGFSVQRSFRSLFVFELNKKKENKKRRTETSS